MNSFIIKLILFLICINPLFSMYDSTNINRTYEKGDRIKWGFLSYSDINSIYSSQPNSLLFLLGITKPNFNNSDPLLDYIRAYSSSEKVGITKVLIGSMENDQLSLFIEDSLISKAISEELSDTLSIEKMLIQRDFDESLFFYIEGKLGKNPVVIRIKLFLENEKELFITKDSFLEYCLSEKKCKSPAFADLFGCKCLNGSSKNVIYHRIEGFRINYLSSE